MMEISCLILQINELTLEWEGSQVQNSESKSEMKADILTLNITSRLKRAHGHVYEYIQKYYLIFDSTKTSWNQGAQKTFLRK